MLTGLFRTWWDVARSPQIPEAWQIYGAAQIITERWEERNRSAAREETVFIVWHFFSTSFQTVRPIQEAPVNFTKI